MIRPGNNRPPAATQSNNEVVLRLGDVLSRIPQQFLKPGPHDASRELRFKIDDLCNGIARGRATVPLTEVARLCPEIFRVEIDPDADFDVQLPLQKLLEQVGAFRSTRPGAPKPKSVAPVTVNHKAEPISATAPDAIIPAAPAAEVTQPLAKPEAVPEPASNGAEETISLDLAAICRLLPSRIVGHSPIPSDNARVALPMRLIEPQLVTGHVEIDLKDFIAALPAKLAAAFQHEKDFKVWIPLDEIFQNLPSHHVFHIGSLGSNGNEPVLPEAKIDEPVAEAAAEVVEILIAPEPERPPHIEQPVAEIIESPAPANEPLPEPVPVVESIAPVTEVLHESPQPIVEAELKNEPAEIEPSALETQAATPFFRPPPPRLFATPAALIAATQTETPIVEDNRSHEQKLADTIAQQPGVFACAVFGNDIAATSERFPRELDVVVFKNQLAALRESICAIAMPFGRSQNATLQCGSFFVSVYLRDRGFLCALHHDRMLAPLVHDVLANAADEL